MTRRAAILGLGTRGLSWASACDASGWMVRGFDPDPMAGKGAWSRDWRREGTISATVARADWVFCCLPERLELVRAVIRRAQAEAPRDALLAISSRNFDLDTLQSCVMRSGQVFRLNAEPDGSLAVDLSDRNPREVRRAAQSGLAELAAILSLGPTEDPGAQLGDAESA